MNKIGFIGIGNMGLPMVLNLLKAKHHVTVYDIETDNLRLVEAEGAVVSSDLPAAVKEQDVVITMLPSGREVNDVYWGKTGIFAQASPKTILIDCSTIDIKTAKSFHAEAAQKGFIAFDAPVSGGTAGAKAGTLTFIVGGDEAKFSQIQPLLSEMGKNIFYAGPGSAGQATKICNNLMLAAHMVGTAEGFFLAKALGLDLKVFHHICNHASGQSWSLTNYCPAPGVLENVPASHEYRPGFAGKMMLKDLKLAEESIAAVGYSFPHFSVLLYLYENFCRSGGAELDFSAIIQAVGMHVN